MDYSLPIASRTRQGRAQFYEDCIVEKKEKMKKGRKESNGVDLAGSSRPHRVDGVKGYERLGSESESFAVSDSSVEEIDVDDCSEEGDELMDFVGNESLKLKNKGNSNKGFEGMANVDEIMLDDSEDEVVILGEGRDFVGEEREEDAICIDVDEEDDMSEKDVTESGELNSEWRRGNDEPVSLRKGKGETSSLNIDERKSSEDGDGCGDAVFDDSCDAVDLVGSDSSLELSSCEEDKDDEDDQDYEVGKLETCASLEQLSSDSGGEEEEKGEDAEEFEVVKRGIHGRGRPKGVDVGLKRRKYGLEILVDVENDEDNCVARRTRSCFVSKLGKKKMKLGTLSHPLCVDEEEVESSSGHDDSDDGADDVGSGGVKAGSNDESEDYSSDDETGHGGKIKSVSASEKFKTNRGNIDACERNLHGKDKGKLKISIKGNRIRLSKGNCIRLSKNCNVLTILADSILEKGDRLEELVSFRDESNPPVAEISLPLKFTFGIQESNPPEKSEEEKEMDKLWADMELALRSSEIGYVDAAEVCWFHEAARLYIYIYLCLFPLIHCLKPVYKAL